MKYFDQYFEHFNISELIKFGWHTFELSENFNDLVAKFGNQINYNIWYFFSIFKNLNEEKVLSFFDFFDETKFKTDIYGHYDSYNQWIELDNIIWEKPNLEDYEDLWVRNKVFLVRELIQKAIDDNDYSNLEENLDVILNIKSHHFLEYGFKTEIDNYDNLKEKLDKLLKETNWFISKEILKNFIFSKLDINIKNSIQNTKKLTEIELKTEDLQNNDIINLLENIWFWEINIKNAKNNDDIYYITKWQETIKFFKKYPTNNWIKWETKDIKEWWILNKILKNINLSNKLIEEQDFSFTDLNKLFSYNLIYYVINNKLDKILQYPQWFYYWYFIEFLNYKKRIFFQNQEIDENFPVNYENFTDFMWDDEILINIPIDNNFKWYKIKPWTKAWFLEKPERKEYLKFDNYKVIKENGSLIWLWILWEDFTEYIEDKNIVWLNKNFDFCRKELGFDVNMLASYRNGNFEFRWDVLDLYDTIIELHTKLYNIKNQDKIKWENYKNFLKYLKQVEKKFKSFKTSIADKQDFYNKIWEYPINIWNKILELTSILSKRWFNYSKRNLLQLIYNEFIFSIKKSKTKNWKTLDREQQKQELEKSNKIIENDISKIIDTISTKTLWELEILEQYNNYFLDELKSNFSNILWIKKIPTELNQEKTNTIINHITYLSNMNNPNSYKESILIFFLSLKLNWLWDKFLKSESININELLNENHINNINNYIKAKKENEVIKWNFSESDLKKLIQEDHILFIWNVQTISDTLSSINANNKEFLDIDMYNDKQKILLSFLEKYNKLLWASLANKFVNLEKGIEIKKENIAILKELKKGLKIDKWTKEKVLEIQQVLKEINPIIKFYNFVEDYKIDDKIKHFEELKIPKENIIKIFSKIWEQFTTNSNVLAVSSDIEYLEKLIKNSDNITPEEKKIVNNYLESIKWNIKELEKIFKYIKDRFSHLYKKISNNWNQIFKNRIEEFSKLIFKWNESKNLISTITSDFDKIIPNIRWCLSCTANECNNDTNLSFWDTNRFFILTNIEWSKKSISDQAVYLFNTNQWYNFVLDTMYWDRSFDLYLSHVLLLIKKIKLLDKNMWIFIPSKVFSWTAFINKLKEEDGITIKNVDNLEIDLNYSASWDIYHEFTSDKWVRESWKSINSWILISKK